MTTAKTTKELLKNFPPLKERKCGKMSGGNIVDFPDHELLREHLVYPDYKRQILLAISSWKGTSAFNAIHFRPRIELNSIPFIDAEYGFRECWDDPLKYHRSSIYPSPKHDEVIYFNHVTNEDFSAETQFGFTYDEKKDDGFTNPHRAMEWIYHILSTFFPKEHYKVAKYEISNLILDYEEFCRMEGLNPTDWTKLKEWEDSPEE